MAKTSTGVNSPRAVKRFSGDLALDVSQQSYFGRRFAAVGQGAKTPIQILTELESEAGELITYDLLTELRMAPVEGDNTLTGKEEAQKFYSDELYIDQARAGVNTGGRMSRKRTLHDLRMRAKQQQAGWWGRFQDELSFSYLSGSRGVNENFLLPLGYQGRANNKLTAPTVNHQLFAGDATSTANIDATDKMTLKLVGDARTRADTQGGGSTNIPVLQPCVVDGEGGLRHGDAHLARGRPAQRHFHGRVDGFAEGGRRIARREVSAVPIGPRHAPQRGAAQPSQRHPPQQPRRGRQRVHRARSLHGRTGGGAGVWQPGHRHALRLARRNPRQREPGGHHHVLHLRLPRRPRSTGTA